MNAAAVECFERRAAELEIIQAAYESSEVWLNASSLPSSSSSSCTTTKEQETFIVYRRLELTNCFDENNVTIPIQISLKLSRDYPIYDSLKVEAQLRQEEAFLGETSSTSTTASILTLQKAFYNALPSLILTTQGVADKGMGNESIFMVLSSVDEWVQMEWPNFCQSVYKNFMNKEKVTDLNQKNESQCVLARWLIHSHHIIANTKRTNIRNLAAEYKLTGYMKIGWPGLVILEGRDDHCAVVYEEMRRWRWQYLEVRGEEQEIVLFSTSNVSQDEELALNTKRRFKEFLEVEDMSLVAQHCQYAGLEALFRTSMKLYDDNSSELDARINKSASYNRSYGALVHVDHMNDVKGYRKWLRKTSKETDCKLVLKQFHIHDDYSKQPIIIVGIVASSSLEVTAFLKRWRTSRVDVDSKGKACYERQMRVLAEGDLSQDFSRQCSFDWDEIMEDGKVTISLNRLSALLVEIGGPEWRDAVHFLALPK